MANNPNFLAFRLRIRQRILQPFPLIGNVGAVRDEP